MRVLVTGGSGFVGTHLRDALIKAGPEVFYFDQVSNPTDDIRDYDAIRRAVDHVQPDYVYHLAALAYVPESTSDVRRAFNVNTLGTINLMEALRQAGSDARVLVSGTSEEYGLDHGDSELITEESTPRPSSLYGISKLSAGLAALNFGQRYGIPVVVTRTVNHTGPGHSRTYAVPAFARRVALAEKYGGVVTHGNLEATRYYLDVRDVVRAYMLAIGLDAGIYNISPATKVTMEDILGTLVSMAKTDVVTEPNPALYRSAGMDVPTISSAKFRAATDWKPEIALRDTLSEVLDYWRRHV
jgi:GDP-4-dehydro-6-deoxy-D-mannose reductase